MTLSPQKKFSLSFKDSVAILQQKSLLLNHDDSKKNIVAEHGVFSDSRKIKKNSVFVAYKGVNQDLHQYITPKLGAECNFVICEKKDFLGKLSCPVIVVKDARAAWSFLCALGWQNPQDKLKFVGVTGTNGKTSVCHMVCSLLEANSGSCLGIGTLGTYHSGSWKHGQHTTPDPDELFKTLAFAEENNVSNIVMEVSSHAVAMQKLLPIKYDISIFTSFSRDHLDYHGTMDAYWQEKMRLFTELSHENSMFIINHSVYGKFSQSSSSNKTYSYGSKETLAAKYNFVFKNLSFKDSLSHFSLNQEIFALAILGEPIIENFCAAYLTSLKLLNKKDGLKIGSAIVPPGRMQPVAFNKTSTKPAVIIDYAHTPDALEKSLQVLSIIASKKSSRVLVVFGCGGDRDPGKRALMGTIAERYADIIIITSDNPRSEDPLKIIADIKQGTKEASNIYIVEGRKQAIQKSIELAGPEDFVLIAGKGHEDYQIVGDQKLNFDDFKVAEAFLNE